jgi:hypothetical protein
MSSSIGSPLMCVSTPAMTPLRQASRARGLEDPARLVGVEAEAIGKLVGVAHRLTS